jgi:hypothetical protein
MTSASTPQTPTSHAISEIRPSMSRANVDADGM